MSSDVAASPAPRSAELRSAAIKVSAALLVGGAVLALHARATGTLAAATKTPRRALETGGRSPRAAADYAPVILEDGAAFDAAANFDRALQATGDHLPSQVGKPRALVALAAAGR